MNEELQKEAIEIVKSEIQKYKDGEYFITENVSIAIRPLIRLLRKNYWGIFDNPKDPVTGKDKQWVPLTRLVVDAVRKNSDLDLKNFNFRSRTNKGRPFTSLIRGFTRAWLYKNFFGETINDSILQMCIDGTVIWKTYTVYENGKLCVKRKTIDILNIFIDPTAESIQDAQRFTERSLMSPLEIEAMTGWKNRENVSTASNLHRLETDMRGAHEIGDYVDVYEMWGLIPKRLITGNAKDTGLVDGHIVVSGFETGDLRVHLIEKNTHKDTYGNVIKPYEELRYIKVPGRWAGVGPAEMVMKLQEWLNTIVNLRINKNRVASLGLFKVKAGAGVTQQMLSNLVSQGVIKLNNLEDMDNFRVDEAGESSYRDEEVAKNWAFDITSTYEIARGASLPATSTATSAVIQDRNAKTAFTIVIENVGLFLQRWTDRHFLPHVPKLIRQEGSVTAYGDFENIDEIRERVVSYLTMQKLDELYASGYVPSEEEVRVAMQEAEKELRKSGDVFFDIMEEIITQNIDTVAQFTNEETDVAVTVKNLTDMANMVQDPAVRNDFLKQALDLLGLDIPESLRAAQSQMNQMPGLTTPEDAAAAYGRMGQAPNLSPLQSEQQVTTGANTVANPI